MEVNVNYEVAAILIALILMFYYGNSKKVSNLQNKIFAMLIECNILTAVFDVVKRVLQNGSFSVPIWVLEILTLGYFLTHFFVAPLFFLYALNMVKRWKECNKVIRNILALPLFAGIILVVINPSTDWIFSFSEDGTYLRHSGLFVMYGLTLFYVFSLIFILVYYRKSYSFVRKISLFVSMLLSVGSVVVQFLYPAILVETCAISVSCLILFFLIQNPRDRIDRATGIFNAAGFWDVMKQNFYRETELDLIQIVLCDMDHVEKNADVQGRDMAMAQIGTYLSEIEEDVNVYRLDSNVYCLELIAESERVVEEVLAVLAERFQKPWKYNNYETVFHANLCHLRLPQQVDSFDRLRAITNDFIKRGIERKVLRAEDFEMERMERSLKISNALVKAVEKNNFEIRYSPVYSPEKKELTAADVSIRFYDEELGFVYDEDIYNFAEQSGQMIQISEMMFEKVCDFIARKKPGEKGIRFFGVKIPTVMCLQHGYMKRLAKVMDKYGVDPGMICLQISEYTVSKAAHVLKETTAELVRRGVRFCLDDYGSGYTNIASVYELPFSIMKLNSSIIKDALQNDKAKITLEYTLMLAKSLHMKTMLEGLEEKQHMDMVLQMPCDYVKGRYFYEQMDEEAFMALLSETKGPDGKGGLLQ